MSFLQKTINKLEKAHRYDALQMYTAEIFSREKVLYLFSGHFNNLSREKRNDIRKVTAS